MGSKIGVIKIAAQRLGISFDEYNSYIASGMKHCLKCRTWKSVSEFCSDKSRGDGKCSTCNACRFQRKTSGPGKRERIEMGKTGFSWCSGCLAWLPTEKVMSGSCREHQNQKDRERYANNTEHRKKIQSRVYQRKRGVQAIPAIAYDYRMNIFNGECTYCPSQADTWDHIHPVVAGGITEPKNVVPCCRSCNSSKKASDVWEWLDRTGRKPSAEKLEFLIYLQETSI